VSHGSSIEVGERRLAGIARDVFGRNLFEFEWHTPFRPKAGIPFKAFHSCQSCIPESVASIS